MLCVLPVCLCIMSVFMHYVCLSVCATISKLNKLTPLCLVETLQRYTDTTSPHILRHTLCGFTCIYAYVCVCACMYIMYAHDGSKGDASSLSTFNYTHTKNLDMVTVYPSTLKI